MLRLFLFMHHIALCTPYIAHLNVVHLLHIRVDHVEPESEIKKGQVQEVGWSTSDKLCGY
jgi:hypothetical protein